MIPDNVYLQLDELKNFPQALEKLSDLWTGIVTPSMEEENAIPWVMPYLKYDINNETRYLIWFFCNTLTEEEIEKEVLQFLEDVEQENA